MVILLAAFSAESVDSLLRELAQRAEEWEVNRQGLQAEVARLEQRAVQADILEDQVQHQGNALEETRVGSIFSHHMGII